MTGRNTNGGRAPSAPFPLKPGDAFNPYRLLNGPLIPFSILRLRYRPKGKGGERGEERALSDGAKLCYGIIAFNMRQTGECTIYRHKLAEQLGSCEATVGRWLKELVDAGLIVTYKQGPSSPAKFRYVWHESLAGCLGKGRTDEDVERAKMSVLPPPRKRSKLSVQQPQNDQNCTPERSDLSVHERSKMSGPYKEYENSEYENILRESSSFEETASVAGSATLEPNRTDDDEPSFEILEPEPEPEPEPVKPEASRWEPTPDEFEAARQCLGQHKNGNPEKKPDAAITRKVVGHFRDAQDFTLWINDLATRFPGSKVKSWGFYGTDAGNWHGRRPEVLERTEAEDARKRGIEQAAEERRRRDEREAEELRRVEAECQRKGWKPVFRFSSKCLQCAGYGRNPVSEEFCRCSAGEELQRCRECNNQGTIAVWPTVAEMKTKPVLDKWCTCQHAERLKAEKGADHIDRQNADAWALFRRQKQSDRWDELYRAHKPILKLIPGFKRLEVGFACSDDEVERAELLERFAQGIVRCSAPEATFCGRAA